MEHAGYVNDSSWFTTAMYRSSARLTASLQEMAPPLGDNHIIGHHEVPRFPGASGRVKCHTDHGRYQD